MWFSVTLNRSTEKRSVASATRLLTAVLESSARESNNVHSNKYRLAVRNTCCRNCNRTLYIWSINLRSAGKKYGKHLIRMGNCIQTWTYFYSRARENCITVNMKRACALHTGGSHIPSLMLL